MRKIKLEMEALEVDSFPTEIVEAADEGTVHGMSGFGCDTFDCYSATNTIECPCQRQFTNEWEC